MNVTAVVVDACHFEDWLFNDNITINQQIISNITTNQ